MQWGVDYQRKVSNKIHILCIHDTNYHIRHRGKTIPFNPPPTSIWPLHKPVSNKKRRLTAVNDPSLHVPPVCECVEQSRPGEILGLGLLNVIALARSVSLP